MMIFGWKNNNFKILGIPILRKKLLRRRLRYSLLGIPIFFVSNQLLEIQADFSSKVPLDTKLFDDRIQSVIERMQIPSKKNTIADNNIVILATELYDMGGHTECIKNIVAAMPEKYKTFVFLTKKNTALKGAVNKTKEISKHSKICGLEDSPVKWQKQLVELFNDITELSPKAVVAFIHMNDVFGATLLGMLRKYTDIKILFFNHGSHYPALGMHFCDLILEGTPTTATITKKQRGLDNTCIVGLPYLKESDLPKFSATEVKEKKKEIGIPDGFLCTMSAGGAYKFFDEHSSLYFEMIKRLLQQNEKLYHVIITNRMNAKRKKIIKTLFDKEDIKKRLITIPTTSDYKILFKCADVFIDSFPISGALTHIDLISMRVPNVVKINLNNPLWSFHEYMPKDYPYAFSKVEDMEQGINKLLQDKHERENIAAINYKYFVNNFEGAYFSQKLIDLIEGKINND